MKYFLIAQFISAFMIFQGVVVHSSFPDGSVSSKREDSFDVILVNSTSSKSQQDKFENDILGKNGINLKQQVNRITERNSLSQEGRFTSDFKSHNYALKCDSFIDMCGECKGGRVDQCNVCGGNNRCVSCNVDQPGSRRDACGSCLLPQDPSWNDCEAIVTIYPLVLDKALNSSAKLRLELTKPLEGNNLSCSVSQLNVTVSARVQTIVDTLVTLSLPLEQLAGEGRLECDGWTVTEHHMIVVDSRSLSVSSVTPTNITLGVAAQLKLMVHGISAPVDLFCFVLDSDRTVTMIQPTNQIAGNPISSSVACPLTITPHNGKRFSVGVAFTRAAAYKMSANNTIDLTVLSTPLIPIRGDFSEDLNSVWVEFNQNIEGTSDCSGVFKNSSFRLLGTGPKCEYRGNRLLVTLGEGASLRPRDKLRLLQYTDSATGLRLPGFGIHPPLTQDSVHLPFTKKPLPSYLLVGPNRLCNSAKLSSVMVVPLTGQTLVYNWSIVVTEVHPWSLPSQRQRRNLLVWLGAREILRPTRHVNSDKLVVNSSLLLSNINYRVEVVGQNRLGLVGPPARLNIQLIDSTAESNRLLDLIILSPSVTSAGLPLPLEARVFSGCENICLDRAKFEWKVIWDNHTMNVDSSSFKATIPAGNLQVPGLYNISCLVMNDSTIVAQGETQVLVKPAKLELTVVPSELVLGTGHTLVLDISKSLRNVNMSTVQLTWKCVGADGQACISPGSDQPILITHMTVLSKPKLVLPQSSLPVGRYHWIAVVKQHGSEYSSSAEVQVVAGHPPLLTLGAPSFSSTHSLTVFASAQDVRAGCRLQWTSLPLLGFNFLSLNNVTGSEREVSSRPRLDFTLMVPTGILQHGARYRLRLSAFCSAAESAFADLIILMDTLPKISAFEVAPLQGVALITQFNFSTTRSTQFGDIYSFGFYPPSGPPLFFYSSAYLTSTWNILPAFKAPVSDLKTVVRVCSPQQLCSTLEGPTVQTSLPESLSPQQIRTLATQAAMAMQDGEPQEAMTSATSMLNTIKLLKDQTAYSTVSTGIIESILQRINQTSERLHKDISIRPNAILFLDSVTRVLPLLQLNDSALSDVVAFRDKLASISSPSGKPARLVDYWLPMEPRISRQKRQHPIPSETPPETPDTVEVWLRTSETVILSFSPNKSMEEKRKLMMNLDSYATGLCQWLPDSQPIYLGGHIVNFSIQKLNIAEFSRSQMTLAIPNCPSGCHNSSANVFLDKDFSSVFKKANIDNICLSGFHFSSGSLDTVFGSPPASIQLSAVYRMKVLIYSASDVLKNEPAPRVRVAIPLQIAPPVTQHIIQCCIMVSETWITEKCETLETTDTMVTCNCPAYMYYSVFAVPVPTTLSTAKTTTEMTTTIATTAVTKLLTSTTQVTTTTATETTTVEEVTSTVTTATTASSQPATTQASTTTQPSTTTRPSTTNGQLQTIVSSPRTKTPTPLPIKMSTMSLQPAKKVAFRIAERFETIVGPNATEFSYLIKKQLIEQLSLPQEAIQYIYITKGSILVTLVLQNTEQVSAEDCVMELSQALGEGQLNLRMPDNRLLDVPRQPLQVLREPGGEQNGLSAVFLASVSLGLCGLVALYITLVTLITKHSRRREANRVNQRKAAEKVPRYSTIPLPHTLEGSSLRQGIHSGDELDSGIYDSDGAKRNIVGKSQKPRNLPGTTSF